MIDVDKIVGKDKTCLQDYEGYLIHKEVVAPFVELKQAAQMAGFDLAIASAYRDYERQLAIWNDKVLGKRAVLDRQGNTLDVATMDDEAVLYAILNWSAIPGTSRHHWGSDLDVYDASAVSASYEVRLTDDEVYDGGVFSALHDWLDDRFFLDETVKFFRPYTSASSCVSPERWHISYWPVSKEFECLLSIELFQRFFASESRLLLREQILKNLDDIFANYISIQHQ